MRTRAKIKRLASEAIENTVQRTFEIDSIEIKTERPDDSGDIFNASSKNREKDSAGVEDVWTVAETSYSTTGNQISELKATPFQCCFCEFSCSAETGLIIHERIHTGLKPFTCEFCAEQFATLSQKVFHERNHSGDATAPRKCGMAKYDRIYACDTCGKTFDQSSGLTTHLRNHSNGHDIEEREDVRVQVIEDVSTEKLLLTLDAKGPRKEEEDVQVDPIEESPIEQISEVYVTKDFQHSEEMENNDRLIQIKIEELPVKLPKKLTEATSVVENVPEPELMHKEENLTASVICKNQLPPKHSLHRHEKILIEKKSFSCEFCDKQFSRKNAHKTKGSLLN